VQQVAEGLREAVDRYHRVQEIAMRLRGFRGPAEPGFKPPTGEELEALSALQSAIAEVHRAQQAWEAAGRPPLE
jgi:hypothetical protein